MTSKRICIQSNGTEASKETHALLKTKLMSEGYTV